MNLREVVKVNKAKCRMCGREFPYRSDAQSRMDVGKEPPHCGRRECATNYEYQKKHSDPMDGYTPSAEKIRKW